MTNRQESAQALALTVLDWLAQDEGRLQAFMQAGGLSVSDLRDRADDPVMLGAVMDHLLSDEPLLLSFCQDTGTPPTAPLRARHDLPGGEVPDWT